MHRALHDGDVALFGIHIHLFEFVSGVAFFGGDETGRHLYAGETEREVVLDVFLIEDAAAEDDGDLLLNFSSNSLTTARISLISFS